MGHVVEGLRLPVPESEDATGQRYRSLAHNVAIEDWRRQEPIKAGRRRHEAAVLELVAAVDQWARLHDADSDALASEAVGLMLAGVGIALNFELGRLAGGPLSEWRVGLYRFAEIDESEWT